MIAYQPLTTVLYYFKGLVPIIISQMRKCVLTVHYMCEQCVEVLGCVGKCYRVSFVVNDDHYMAHYTSVDSMGCHGDIIVMVFTTLLILHTTILTVQ